MIHIAAGLTGNAKTLIHDNIEATKKLIRYAEKAKIKRMIYLSTVAVYGYTGKELSEDSNPINPSVYGMTKHICESLVKESEIPEKLIIQLPKMIGPFVHMEDTSGSGFLTMTKKILQGETVVCYIPELQYNNYLHVSELEKFLEHMLLCEEWKRNEKILVGARERLTMMEILGIMRDESGSKSEIIPRCNGILPECFLINISKAETLGFTPCSAEDMLRRFIQEVRIERGHYGYKAE